MSTTRRVALAAVAIGLATGTAVVTLTNTASAGTTLGASAAEKGRYFGAAVAANKLGDSHVHGDPRPRVQHGHARERDEVGRHRAAAGPVHLRQRRPDRQPRARANGMRMRGHALVWHSQQPGWAQSLSRQRPAQRDDQPRHPGRHPLQGQDLRLGRGQRGVRRRQQRRPARLQPAAHRQRLDRGRLPHRARRRPGRQALLQRLQHRRQSTRSRTGVYNMVRDFKARGVPIDCVGFQSHLNSDSPCPATTRPTCSASPTSASTCRSPSWTSQGSGTTRPTSTRTVIQRLPGRVPLHRHHRRGASATATRGAAGDTPLLFDGNGNKKPAYTAVLNALNAGSSTSPPPVSTPPVTTPPTLVATPPTGRAERARPRSR